LLFLFCNLLQCSNNDNGRPDEAENTHDISDFKCKGHALVINNAASALYSTKLQETFIKLKFKSEEIDYRTIETIRQKLHDSKKL
jgi:hypothetical protein